MEYMVMKQ